MQDPGTLQPFDGNSGEEQGRRGEKRRDFPAAELLRGDSPQQVLERLTKGDPLELGARLPDRLEEQGYLIFPVRVIDLLFAHIAYGSMDYEGDPPLEVFLQRCIDKAVASYLTLESEDERKGAPIDFDGDPYYVLISEMLGVERDLSRLVLLHYNHLPLPTRRTFHSIMIVQKSMNRWVAEGNGPPERIRDQLEYALEFLSSLGGTSTPDPDGLKFPDPPGGTWESYETHE